MKRYPIPPAREKFPTAHRPWPLPARPWVGRKTWADLLFAHWRVHVEQIRHLVPPGLDIQELDALHMTMMATWHPAKQSDDLAPIREKTPEMVAKLETTKARADELRRNSARPSLNTASNF